MRKAQRNCRLIALAILPVTGLFGQDLAGIWQGTVRNPDTKDDLRTVLKIASSDGDPIKGNFYSIDQTYLVFPATLTVQALGCEVDYTGDRRDLPGEAQRGWQYNDGDLEGFFDPHNVDDEARRRGAGVGDPQAAGSG
jgi:hypothetical protein